MTFSTGRIAKLGRTVGASAPFFARTLGLWSFSTLGEVRTNLLDRPFG